MFEFSKEKTRHSFKNSLDNLGLDYVDVIQVNIYSGIAKFSIIYL